MKQEQFERKFDQMTSQRAGEKSKGSVANLYCPTCHHKTQHKRKKGDTYVCTTCKKERRK